MERTYPDTFLKNYSWLKARNVNVLLGPNYDACKLHVTFHGQRFKRIQFNCPYKEGRPSQTTPSLMAGFFKSAREIQKEGDKIKIVLPKPQNRDGKNGRGFRFTRIYNLYNASVESGYKRIKEKHFLDNEHGLRYPGYEHRETYKNKSAPVASRLVEYVFVKTNLTPEALKAELPPDNYQGHNYLSSLDVDLDSVSSDCEDSSPAISQPSTPHLGSSSLGSTVNTPRQISPPTNAYISTLYTQEDVDNEELEGDRGSYGHKI